MSTMKAILALSLLAALLKSSDAQRATTNEIREARYGDRKLTNPFLSTTMSTTITSASDDLNFDFARRAAFSETLTHFLAKLFRDQQVYGVKIISVNLFEDHVLTDGRYEEAPHQKHSTLSFSTVVSAEYTEEDQIDSITDDNFRKMLIHVCDKFQGHLIQYLKDTGDPYLMNVERVVLGDFERIHRSVEGKGAVEEDSSNNVLGLSDESLNTVSIIVIVMGVIVFLALVFASVKYYREEKQLKAIGAIGAIGFSPREFESTTESAASSQPKAVPTLSPAVDDYSFNPLTAGDLNRDAVAIYTNYKDNPSHGTPISSINEETVSFSSVWPESAPPTLFPARASGAAIAAAAPKALSYTEELNKLPKQHVFAPPGKIGIALDVVNGQPIVHKVRRKSPLENMLRPNDVILAIDDEDASCLSAADVTSMMVKRMDRVRKITFVRRG